MKNPKPSPRILHVAPKGDDSNSGSEASPLRTISAAAKVAGPGDTVRVQTGIYRERIDPPRGGLSNAERITYEAAEGAAVEIRGSEPLAGWRHLEQGLWEASVPNTVFGDYNPFAQLIEGDWFLNMGRPHHTANLYFNDTTMHEAVVPENLQQGFWCARVEAERTAIRANFGPNDPNASEVEMNVRPTIFYPSRTGINYITVRGFTLTRAATQWAPPTAEQIGLVGTNWSKGWIIEDCTITHSRCVGVTLGKYGDEYDNTSANSAGGYIDTIERALARGWNRETVGSHIVRNNTIAHCEQAGIVGSLGAIFSEVSGNVIHDIHVHRLFNGAEQAGIKFHAPIDTLIAGNHIYRTIRGMWMDWMTQGTRITRNLCHDNVEQDLFVEVNHGPFVVDHNIFLSPMSLWSVSQGGAYLHNLFGGKISRMPELRRETPWHLEHSTEIAGITNIRGGDERYINNLFLCPSALKSAEGEIDHDRSGSLEAHKCHPNQTAGNAFLTRAPELVKRDDGHYLELSADASDLPEVECVTTVMLGQSAVAELPYRDYDGAELRLEVDYHDDLRTAPAANVAGPLVRSKLKGGAVRIYGTSAGVGSAEKIMVI